MNIRVICPRGHLVATVEMRAAAIVPTARRHGLAFDYAPTEGITRLRATCRKCGYDACSDYGVLRDALAAVPPPAAGKHAEYRLTL